jgi:hypothetical protein
MTAMEDRPNTLVDIAERLARRSMVISLPYRLGQELDLVAPGGTSADTHRPGLVHYGPLTWSVLSSLWSIGYPGRQEELRSITDDVRRVMAAPDSFAPGGEPLINIRRALLLWRVLAAYSQLLEEVSALAAATRDWQAEGYPRGLECGLGEAYLKWDPVRGGGIQTTLHSCADADVLFQLLAYPDTAEASAVVAESDAMIVARLARTSAELASTGFAALAISASPSLRRTFARYKHRITATSPGSAPLCLPHRAHDEWAATDERFTSGFGILDWAPRSAHPEAVLWPATNADLADYTLLMTRAFELFGLLIASLVRFADPEVAALPLLLPPTGDLTGPEQVALQALSASDYRALAIARRHAR